MRLTRCGRLLLPNGRRKSAPEKTVTFTFSKTFQERTLMSGLSERIILALDVDSFEAAEAAVIKLSGIIGIFKVGQQLFTRCGPRIIEMIHDHRGRVFLDLKFHDIPNTVARAVEEASKHKVFMLTVHALGGKKMMAQ